MEKLKTVIVDFDGTIANIKHRLREINGELDWDYALDPNLVKLDALIGESIPVLNYFKTMGFHIIILTGRPKKQEKESIKWLAKHNIPHDRLILRDTNFGCEDNVPFKRDKIETLLQAHEILIAFDDSKEIISLFQEYNINSYHIDRNNPNKSWREAQSLVSKWVVIYNFKHLITEAKEIINQRDKNTNGTN